MRWWALILLSACGADSSATLRVDLRTDLAAGAEISDVRVRVLRDGELVGEQVHLMDLGRDYLDGVRVGVFEEVPFGTLRIEVSAVSNERVVVQRDLAMVFRQESGVTMILTRSCGEVTCGEGQSCVAGRCESNLCTPETPDECTLSVQCTTDGDCGGGATDCGSARCVDGACYLAAAPTGCAPGSWCVPTDGCRPQSTSASCIDDPPADPDAIAVYAFDGDQGSTVATDARDAHEGMLGDDTRFVVGPEGCGTAVSFDSVRDVLVIPDSPDFDLVEGSVDFYLRHDGTEDFRAVVSRDAVDTARPGHFTAALLSDGRLAVRIQSTGDGEVNVCSSALASNRWHHVGINFGAPGVEIWLNGVRSEDDSASPGPFECGQNGPLGLAGTEGENDNPWYVGANRYSAPEGEIVEATDPLFGAVDQLRISANRRDFSGYAL